MCIRDRFSRIEIDLQNLDTIVNREEYWKIFSNHGIVFKIGDDWKLLSQQNMKKLGQWHFKF